MLLWGEVHLLRKQNYPHIHWHCSAALSCKVIASAERSLHRQRAVRSVDINQSSEAENSKLVVIWAFVKYLWKRKCRKDLSKSRFPGSTICSKSDRIYSTLKARHKTPYTIHRHKVMKFIPILSVLLCVWYKLQEMTWSCSPGMS